MRNDLGAFLADGVNSPIPTPPNFPRRVISGRGPWLIDNNGRSYIDLWMGFGALLYGHSDALIANAVREGLEHLHFSSIPTPLIDRVSQQLHENYTCAERVRFATTGSDATMLAARLARHVTGRSRILRVHGGYHGGNEFPLSDGGLVKSVDVGDCVLFNDLATLGAALATREFAAFMVEPVLANNGCVPPHPTYLQQARALCSENDTLLIFDEVVTGFRLSAGGAQSKFGVTPDLCTLSKAIAGGLPLSALCGRADLMTDVFFPRGPVFHAGTFAGHPLALHVASAHIDRLNSDPPYDAASNLARIMGSHMDAEMRRLGIKGAVQREGSMLSVAFGVSAFQYGVLATNFDTRRFDIFVAEMAMAGCLMPPLPTETIFMCPAHAAVMDQILLATTTALTAVSRA